MAQPRMKNIIVTGIFALIILYVLNSQHEYVNRLVSADLPLLRANVVWGAMVSKSRQLGRQLLEAGVNTSSAALPLLDANVQAVVSRSQQLGSNLLAGVNSSWSYVQSASQATGDLSALLPAAPTLQFFQGLHESGNNLVPGTTEAAGASGSSSSCVPSCRPGSVEWNRTGIPAVPRHEGLIQFQPAPEFRPSNRPVGCFAVLAVLAREEHVLVEWLEHYYSEGAGHIYIGNNNLPGTVEYSIFRRQIEPYEKAGILTWWQMPAIPKKSFLKKILWLDRVWNKAVVPRIRRDNLVKWLLVVDLDEFAYAANVSSKMSDFLCSPRTDVVSQFCIPYNMYGTSGYLKQPACIVPNFVNRDAERMKSHGKCVVRLANLSWLSVHYHEVSGSTNAPELPGSPWKKYFARMGGRAIRMKYYHANEGNWHEWPLRLNHYQMQSLQHFRIVRNNRSKTDTLSSQGTGTNGSRASEKGRLVWDGLSVKDDLLASKMHWKKLWWDCNRSEGPLEWGRYAHVSTEP
jgi:hypothetical protein